MESHVATKQTRKNYCFLIGAVFTASEPKSGAIIVQTCQNDSSQGSNVPFFVNIGDKVKVDTRTDTYLERVK